jgi:hypothetical protein
MQFNFRSVSVVSVLLLLAGCAQVKPDIDAAHSSDAVLRTNLANSIQEPVIESNGFDVSAEASADLLGAFDKRAASLGLKISTTGVPVRIDVKDYNRRPVAARILFGVMAGRDHIKAVVSVGNSTFEVEDSARSAVNGLGVVARNVGAEAANGIAMLAGLPTPDDSRQQVRRSQ